MNPRSFYTTAVATEHYLGIRWPREIWASVLKQAVTDAINGLPPFELPKGLSLPEGRALSLAVQQAAENWIDDDENEPRRFVWVCEQLGVDPDAVRKEIERRKNGT